MPKTRSFNPPGLFRSILCPVDFSDHSAVALRYAAILAKRSAGRLHVLHVNDPMLAAAAAVAFADRDYAKVALAELRPFVAKALPASTMKAISIRYAVDTGDPARMIASAAKRFRCDLIVMGTHGLSGLEKVLIGSTTERMLRRASLPLLAVPPSPPETMGAQAPARLWPDTAMMVPVDLGEQSTRDIREAEQIARAFGTDLVLVHVVPPLQPPPWYRADLSAHRRMQLTKAQRRLESLAKTIGPGVNTEIRVVAGRPADEISALAAEERIGLVVMHLRKGPGLFGSRAGSIAAHVLRHAVTPVLALPGRTVNRPINARASSRKRVLTRA
ncbi:MAG: universal stress protein [Vicinamibacterales bacterium]|nr:universal stress protein [Vicinamibacterales bacterium]